MYDDKNKINQKVIKLNEYLLTMGGDRDCQIYIHNKEGKKINLRYRVVDLKGILPYEEMYKRKFYCQGDTQHPPHRPDKVHIKGVYFEKVLEQMFLTLENTLKQQPRVDKRNRKRKACALE